jgi:hypothetical protein
MRSPRYLVAALALAGGAILTGCGSSDNGSSADAATDSPVNTDAKTDGKPGSDAGKDGATDATGDSPTNPDAQTDAATDGPCNFATFVIGLITNDTTATATPSTDLGQACTDNQNQAEFKSLFP